MKGLVLFLLLGASLLVHHSAIAANVYAGKNIAQQVCSQCHGLKKPADGAPFPSLNGRDRDYLEMAIKQYRDKVRKSEIMNNIAGSLSDKDIANISAYYARLKP